MAPTWRVEIDVAGFPANLVPHPGGPTPRYYRGGRVSVPIIEPPHGKALGLPAALADGEATYEGFFEADNAWYAAQLFLEQLPEGMLRGATKLSTTTEALR